MKLLQSTENKITKDKNGENVPHLEITEVVLVNCNMSIMIINKIQDSCTMYVLVMSRTHFRVDPHSIVAGISKNSLLEAGTKSEVYVTATGLEPRTT